MDTLIVCLSVILQPVECCSVSPVDSGLWGTSAGCTGHRGSPSSAAREHGVGLAAPARHESVPLSINDTHGTRIKNTNDSKETLSPITLNSCTGLYKTINGKKWSENFDKRPHRCLIMVNGFVWPWLLPNTQFVGPTSQAPSPKRHPRRFNLFLQGTTLCPTERYKDRQTTLCATSVAISHINVT